MASLCRLRWSVVHPFPKLPMAFLQKFVLLKFFCHRARARLRVLLRISHGRRAVVDLLRPVGNVGLLQKRGLPRVLKVNQRRYGGPALRLRFQGQPQKRFQILLVFLQLRSARQASKNGLQCCGLAYQQSLQRVQVTAFRLNKRGAQLVN